ncbi:MAG: acetylglutamate kinase [Lactococcus cremoris]|uniref:Acetylglutamate kinase n=4 Tax=Lactococcus lactis subsp. cremoris TaxID=1359 RepID=T0S6L3_LACLC|nr:MULTISPECIES: acetylglutamate kinase [Lactococcus]EQC53692.1 acetylglutamate kinase [Lactococcus cremoris subsp. cremoris TIFN5]EQC54141.1 acetylglutamate kinase [Lactococcus cremoris subsp. cremoris TIFN6]EQC86659.1 acetylglutamate kinase [Lactococcus cremoris subsp. cremoris TIFN1]EQC94290.1 acetylglutamate kinase [Lactococcus cremoris subsp. cremoris TIFN3]AFW91403.1 acetylglutamate kinase [Lactococcus cremoris subsp. cremoris UC509.9]
MTDSQITAQILTESLKYFLKYRDQTVVIKYGGNAMIDEKVKESILKDILLLKTVGIKVVLVHGGGPAIGELLEKYEQKSQFVQGLRVTNKKTAQLALTALAGKVNKSLVQDIIRLGGNAIGVSGIDGKLIEAKPISEDLGYVGEITAIHPEIIERINQTDAVPVIASAAIGLDGEIYNVNADTAASRIAGSLCAEQFILLSDVRGLYGNFPDEGSFIDEINLTNLEKLVKEKKITDGMIPKIEAIKYAMQEGLGQAVLLDGRVPHALLLELFTDRGQGTLINH